MDPAVAVFLRALEYHRGIVFLTTVRVPSIHPFTSALTAKILVTKGEQIHGHPNAGH